MSNIVLSDIVASVSELKKHPMRLINQAQGNAIAILNRNKPVFYCVSPNMFEYLMDKIEDSELAKIIAERNSDEEIEVDINDL